MEKVQTIKHSKYNMSLSENSKILLFPIKRCGIYAVPFLSTTKLVPQRWSCTRQVDLRHSTHPSCRNIVALYVQLSLYLQQEIFF